MLCCPNPTIGSVQVAIFFLFLFFDSLMHVCNRSWSSLHPPPSVPSPLFLPCSCQVLLFLSCCLRYIEFRVAYISKVGRMSYWNLGNTPTATPLPPRQPVAVRHASFCVTDLASGLCLSLGLRAL